MFKKGQLVRSATRRNRLYRVDGIISDCAVTVLCLGSGLRGPILNRDIELIGNNYKEKPRD